MYGIHSTRQRGEVAIIKKGSGDKLREVTLGTTKYLYKMDVEAEKDCLIDNSNKLVKVNLSFSKNPNKNKIAKDGLKSFFTELYS